MAAEHKPTDDIFYDLVSIQYHALQGAELYGKYLETPTTTTTRTLPTSSGKSRSRTGRGPFAATSCSAT